MHSRISVIEIYSVFVSRYQWANKSWWNRRRTIFKWSSNEEVHTAKAQAFTPSRWASIIMGWYRGSMEFELGPSGVHEQFTKYCKTCLDYCLLSCDRPLPLRFVPAYSSGLDRTTSDNSYKHLPLTVHEVSLSQLIWHHVGHSKLLLHASESWVVMPSRSKWSSKTPIFWIFYNYLHPRQLSTPLKRIKLLKILLAITDISVIMINSERSMAVLFTIPLSTTSHLLAVCPRVPPVSHVICP